MRSSSYSILSLAVFLAFGFNQVSMGKCSASDVKLAKIHEGIVQELFKNSRVSEAEFHNATELSLDVQSCAEAINPAVYANQKIALYSKRLKLLQTAQKNGRPISPTEFGQADPINEKILQATDYCADQADVLDEQFDSFKNFYVKGSVPERAVGGLLAERLRLISMCPPSMQLKAWEMPKAPGK